MKRPTRAKGRFVLDTLKLCVKTQISMLLPGGSLGACRFDLLLLGELDGVEDQVDSGLFAHRGIHHQVKLVAVGPFNAEVLLDEGGALAVRGFGEMCRVGFALTSGTQAADLVLVWSVDEYVEGVAAALQVIR